jgi:hypothetical protein
MKVESEVLNTRREVPSASTAPPVMGCFAGLPRGRRYGRLSTAMGWIPTAYRPPGNEPFCRAFSPIMVTAVDAVATFLRPLPMGSRAFYK